MTTILMLKMFLFCPPTSYPDVQQLEEAEAKGAEEVQVEVEIDNKVEDL